MDQAQNLRQTMRRFDSEMDRLMTISFVNLPAALQRLLDALDSEPVISSYLEECIDSHVPETFDATAEFERVAGSSSEVFGPFPTEHRAAAGEAYLVIQELYARRVKFHDPLFMGYVDEPAKTQERFGAFKADVIMRLIDDVSAHLAALADEAGVDLTQDGSSSDGAEPLDEPAAGFSEERLSSLLAELEECINALPDDDCEDARLQLEALRDELTTAQPKRSVVKVLLRVLGAIGGDVRYLATLGQLKACLEAGGLC